MTTTSTGRRPGVAMWRRYAAFLRAAPELTLTWHDAETGARAWLVINSSRGGAAGGGTRMRPGIGPREVVYLAKAMELKFAIAGPAIGGAKTGIDFDPLDPRKPRVLERWYTTIAPLLRERYGTGGDLNVDEVLEVLPTFERLGLEHPQEGVVRGHLRPDSDGLRDIMRRMDLGVSARLADGDRVPDLELTVADTVTGYGLAVAVRRLHERTGRELRGVRVSLEGFGNVGAACALYLARAGARIVGISDARSALVAPGGLEPTEIEALIARRQNKLIPADDPRVRPRAAAGPVVGGTADVFVCAAISESITPDGLDALEAAGVRVIACGANQPFREVKIGSTRVAQAADRRFTVLADVLSNCGMARTFSYLMEPGAEPASHAVFRAVEATIEGTLDEVLDRTGHRATTLLAATLDLALDRIGAA
jgi:glutamate dehydrogenase/leucine dehydrogenase